MRRLILAAVLVVCVGLPAMAQEQADGPGSRLEQLEARVAALEAERDALRVRLGEAIEALRNLGYAPPPPVLAEPTDPMASPAAVMQTLRRRARLELMPLARASAEDRSAYRQSAQDWVRRMTDAFTGEREWLVRVLGVQMPASGSSVARATVRVQVFDATTAAPLSAAMEIAVPGRIARRMADGGVDRGWRARVSLKPDIRHNPDRAERGPFDYPPFLAPEVEATIGVEWLRFEPTDVPEGFFPALERADPLDEPAASGAGEPAGEVPARQPR